VNYLLIVKANHPTKNLKNSSLLYWETYHLRCCGKPLFFVFRGKLFGFPQGVASQFFRGTNLCALWDTNLLLGEHKNWSLPSTAYNL